ncbi:MAG: phage holin family protein [Acidimicrobiales bacterium]
MAAERARASDAPPSGGQDWASQATRHVESVVSLVRDRTVAPATKFVKYALLAVLGAFVAALVLVLVAVGFIRLLDTEVFHRRVWASYLIAGGIFFVAGVLLSRVRRRRV